MKKPNLFIVGAPKAGTTFLYDKLCLHPMIFTPRIKELNYFSYKYLKRCSYYNDFKIKNINKYMSFYESAENQKYLIDASVSYFSFNNTANEIFSFNKNAKIVIVLRDPVERAFSHYMMDYRMGHANFSFVEYLEGKEKFPLHYFQYIHNSLYSDNIKRYVDIFGEDNVFIMKLEHLDKDIRRLFDFLKIPDISSHIDTKEKINTKKNPRNPIARFFLRNRNLTQRIKFLLPYNILKFWKKIMYDNSVSFSIGHEERRLANDILSDELKKYYL